MKKALRFFVVFAFLFAFLGVPAIRDRQSLASLTSGVDAVAGASVEVPDQPSGAYWVLLNRTRHPDTAAVWTDFFQEQPVDVIFEDLDCVVIDADAAGGQLAERYQARLAENQMKLRRENGLLAVSRAQWGVFDVLIVSREMADAYRFDTVRENADVVWIEVGGGT